MPASGEDKVSGAILTDIGDFRLRAPTVSLYYRVIRRKAYQIKDSSRGSLFASLLGEEEQTLAGVCSPGDVLAGGILCLLAAQVAGKGLRLDGLGSKVEEFLLEDEAPRFRVSSSLPHCTIRSSIRH